MRGAATAVLAAVFLLADIQVALASPVPSKDELRKKSTKELKKILKSKGAKCHKCTEKDEVVERVIETWDRPPSTASSPDGGVQMTKEQFIEQLKMSFSKARSDQGGKGGGADSDGHELDDDGGAGGMHPDYEKVWAEFAEKLTSGDIGKDENGNLLYEVGAQSGFDGFWEKWKMHAALGLNLFLLYAMRKLKKVNRLAEEHKTTNDAPAVSEGSSDSKAIDGKTTGPGEEVEEEEEDKPKDKDT